MSDKPKATANVQSLARGLKVLESFTESSPSLRLVDIVNAVGLSTPVVLRFVRTLIDLGYLHRDPVTKRYRPGIGVLRLGFAFLNGMELAELAEPYLLSLSEKTGHHAELSVRDGTQVVTVAQSKPVVYVIAESKIGSRQPAYCTAQGKAQLFDLGRDNLRDLLGVGPFPARGPNTRTDIDALTVDLEECRARGYAINDEELVAGLLGLAAPVYGRDRLVMAGVGITLLRSQVDDDYLHKVLAPLVLRTASLLSECLGATGGSPRVSNALCPDVS